MKQTITILTLSFLITTQLLGQPTTNLAFMFSNTAYPNTLRAMEQNAKAVFDEINNASRENRTPRFSTANITSDGITNTLALWATSKFHCSEPAYRENVSENSYGGYQVRNITTFFKDVGQSQDLVVDFDRNGKVSNISIAISKTQYNSIMQTGSAVTDFRYRQIILDFVENFRTAYNRQDVGYIEKMFNDEALIITGTKLTIRTGDGQYATKTKYSTQSKQQYINKLRTAIMEKDSYGNKLNKINVDFERIEIIKSANEEKIYLVRLWQKWDSKGKINYGDEGWLTLVIDFQNEQEPTIWVRAWQDGKFKKEELYNFNCFYAKSTCE